MSDKKCTGYAQLFDDRLLAERKVSVVEGGQRGQGLPRETPLTALRMVGHLREGEDKTDGIVLQARALDMTGPCYSPYGRDLLGRILEDEGGEGTAFLATLDQRDCYVFAGDQDLRDKDGRPVVLYLRYCNDRWDWSWYFLNLWDLEDYFGFVQLFTLSEPS